MTKKNKTVKVTQIRSGAGRQKDQIATLTGLGLGKILLRHVLDKMKQEGFKECYLETMNFMNQANLLYQKSGFNRLDRPKGDTGHSWTNCWYIKKL